MQDSAAVDSLVAVAAGVACAAASRRRLALPRRSRGASSAGAPARAGERKRRQLAGIGGRQGGQHGTRGRDEPDRARVRGRGHGARLPPRLQGGGGRVRGGDRLGAARHAGGREPAARHGRVAVRVAVDGDPLLPQGVRPRAAHLPRRPAAAEPGGVPVRGVVYFLAILLAGAGRATTAAARRSLARLLPWYLRDLALPALRAPRLLA